MRAVLLAALVVAVGCGVAPDATTGAGRGGSKVDAPAGPPVAYAGEYDGENPVAADDKYKGKRVTFARVEIDRIDRTKDGRAFVAPLSVLVQAPSAPAGTGGLGGHTPGRVPEPCYYFFLTDDKAKGVKAGAVYDITGTCRGYQKDNLWRGNAPGMNWHVDFEDCDVKPAKAFKK